MKATVSLLATLLLVGAASSAKADPFYPGYPAYPGYPGYACMPQAPDACHGGFMGYNPCGGCSYGPIYCVRPPWEPFNGPRPVLGAGQGYGGAAGGQPAFPTHPYARSPRDFFMAD